MNVDSLKKCYKNLEKGGKILDIGCLGFTQQAFGEKYYPNKFSHFGVDYCEPESVPEGFTFKKADLNRDPLPFDDDQFDLVVAKHVIEHLQEPLEFFKECLRTCKPGGLLYLEAPSERSLFLPGMPIEHEKFYSLSFFDDPTHTSRPWTPQAFYRMTKLFGCEPIKTGHRTSRKHRLLFPINLLHALITRNGKRLEKCVWFTIGWASYLIVRKPEDLAGAPNFSYYYPNRS